MILYYFIIIIKKNSDMIVNKRKYMCEIKIGDMSLWWIVISDWVRKWRDYIEFCKNGFVGSI